MSFQNALEVVSLYHDALAHGKNDQMALLRSSNFLFDLVHNDAQMSGPLSTGGTDAFWATWFKAFIDHDWQNTRTIAAEKIVVTQWVFSGIHSGAVPSQIFPQTIEPTGHVITIRGVSIYDISLGLIDRETMYIDLVTLMVELGVVL